MSIINKQPEEIMYFFLDNLMLRSHDSAKKKDMHIEIGRIQLDNQALSQIIVSFSV
jgi:hypothetical protein